MTVAAMVFLVCAANAQLRITLPKRSHPTPVQKLNQDGVKAVQKRDYEKAKKLFYKAYLLDPNDPFTLNNLGFMAELEGEVERAQRFYELAGELSSDATVAVASNSAVEGKPLAEVAGKTQDRTLLVNKYNLEAIALLKQDRASEADMVLAKALKLDPGNPFTLNNLGFAKEKQGELEQALRYYQDAWRANSSEPVVVTAQAEWRGKAISTIASENAGKLQKLMRTSQTREARIARLNLQGVSALNRNQPGQARRYFEQAYRLDPEHAFTLNNMGYLAEMEGDRESADFYYARAKMAKGREGRVDVATRVDAEGRPIGEVAGSGEAAVQQRIEAERQARMRRGGPVVLRTRDGQVVREPERPPQPPAAPQASPQQELLMPLPDNQQPPAAQPAPAQPAPAQPDAPQPQVQQPPQQPPPPGGLLMPLPEEQQPPAAQP
jgi:Flp pilus assembly protein TadD